MRIIFLIFFIQGFANECVFTPPPGWEMAKLKNPSPYLKLGFLGKGEKEFRPSINLSVEEGVGVSLKEYVKAVKEIQKEDPTAQLRDLGPFAVKSGSGRLLEIASTSPWGEIRMLQLLFVEGGKAYILTAAALKGDFVKIQSDILQSFQSLSIVEK